MTEDIILVTIDSLRADHCGWQSDSTLTPFLDALAAESLTFTSAISPGPQTFISVPTTLTGSPMELNEDPITGGDDRAQRMQTHLEQTDLVSKELQAEGYTTVAFTANPWTSADVGFDEGFDTFVEVGREGGEIHSLFRETPVSRAARLFDLWLHKDSWFSQWRTFYDDVMSTIEEVPGPVFAWIFLLEPHNPYLVPREDRHDSSTYGMYAGLLRGNQIRRPSGPGGDTSIQETIDETTLNRLQDAYRDCVRSVDVFVERLVSDIDSESLLLFHSDHGEAFGEHGSFGHQQVLYEENIHVPLLIHGAGVEGDVDAPVSTIELPEMILDYVRSGELDPSEYTTEYAISRTLDDSAIALRGDRWKYVRTDEGKLYDLDDHGESVDVSGEFPAVYSELETRCDEFLGSLSVASTPETEMTGNEEMKEHLQSLGYLQK